MVASGNGGGDPDRFFLFVLFSLMIGCYDHQPCSDGAGVPDYVCVCAMLNVPTSLFIMKLSKVYHFLRNYKLKMSEWNFFFARAAQKNKQAKEKGAKGDFKSKLTTRRQNHRALALACGVGTFVYP